MKDIEIKSVNKKCVECGAYERHSPRCSLMPKSYAKKELARYYEAWLKMEIEIRKREKNARNKVKKAKEQSELWKCKFFIVKDENNKLRKKILGN